MKSKKVLMGVLSVTLGLGALVGYSVERARASGIPATQAMTYSGVLTDASGTPLTGSKNIQIQIYDMATGGTVQCTVGPTAITLATGGFRLALPDTCTTAVHATPDLWIEVDVDGTSLGRTKLGAVPFAVEAETASAAAGMLAQQIVPSGAVVAFNLGACPSGWTALPAAQGRAIIGTNPSAGNGLSLRSLGDTAGEEQHTMTVNELVPHTHGEMISNVNGYTGTDGESSGDGFLGATHIGYATGSAGGGQPFNNMQPSLALLYCQKS